MIDYALNRQQADTIFTENAVMMGEGDVIYDYRVAEIFGADVCAWAESCMHHEGFFTPGRDWNSWGSCDCHYFTRAGFNKIVAQHNYMICCAESANSDGGQIWRDLWQARRERLDAADREAERKREERKAKREAARRAKQAAQEVTA